MHLMRQPPYSPDLSINDLAFFRALQSCQWDSVEEAREDKDSLIEAVLAAYADFEPMKLNFAFLTLHGCLEEIITSHGDNQYSIPHMGKEALLLTGQLPTRVEASEAAVDISSLFVDEIIGDGIIAD
jgi:hypothetical protein